MLVLTLRRLSLSLVFQGDGKIDLDMTMTTLGPEDDTAQGLIVPNRDRVMYRPPPGKSALGMMPV